VKSKGLDRGLMEMSPLQSIQPTYPRAICAPVSLRVGCLTWLQKVVTLAAEQGAAMGQSLEQILRQVEAAEAAVRRADEAHAAARTALAEARQSGSEEAALAALNASILTLTQTERARDDLATCLWVALAVGRGHFGEDSL
jgi:hypothetical protein